MKKRFIVAAAIILVAMSSLTDVALSLSEDSQWTPYVLSWKQKLHAPKIKKQTNEIPICKPGKDKRVKNTTVKLVRGTIVRQRIFETGFYRKAETLASVYIRCGFRNRSPYSPKGYSFENRFAFYA